jgi:hypothetical protein
MWVTRKPLRCGRQFVNQYFWRTDDQAEIDDPEDADGQVRGYAFQSSSTGKANEPADFLRVHPGDTIQRVDRSNFWRLLLR